MLDASAARRMLAAMHWPPINRGVAAERQFRRCSLKVWLLVRLSALAALVLWAGASMAADSKPNIVFFLVDDMGWQETSVPFHSEVTALNRRYRTPNMERLASEGMKFTQAYASAVCSPTRVSALTGMNVARHRVTNWTLRKNISPDDPHKTLQPPSWNVNGICTNAGIERTMQVKPLPALLRASGYRTIHVGKAHFGAKNTPGENPLNLGFDVNIAGHAAGGPGSYWGEKDFSAAWRTNPPDRIWDVPGLEAYHGKDIYLTEALTREAVKALEQAVADHQPFCLYLSHYAVHAPWEKDDRFYQRYLDAGLTRFEATLASMIEGMDKSLGDVMGALDRLGVADNTIILFMSDNGAPSQCPANLPLRGHKLTPYEGGIREPMLVKWPGVTRPASICREPVVIEDFFPTILELAGAEWRGKTLQTVDGVSFAPLLKGEDRAPGERAFVWHFPHQYSGQGPFSALRQGPWKLIYHHTDRRLELFNIDADISETRDVSKDNPVKVTELAERLTERLRAENALMPTDRANGQAVPWPAAVAPRASPAPQEAQFRAPPWSARPWVYWFWLDGNITAEGITADLEAMQRVGLGGALWMWGGGVGEGVKGPVKFLSPQWFELMRHTVQEADRLGLKLNLTAGSGWSHSGGAWIKPEHSMRRLELSQELRLTGPGPHEITLPSGEPVVAILAYPMDEQSLTLGEDAIKKAALPSGKVIDLTSRLDSARHVSWEVPPGTWTVQILRHRSTGDQPHPILPDEGGLECDKLSPDAVDAHWNGYIRRVLDECGPAARRVIRYVHADSYEFGPQTWTPKFREEFRRRCGYDPLPYLPAILGRTVDDKPISERFLWDFRRVRADLFAEGIGGHLRELCEREGMSLTTEPHLIPEVFDQIQYGGHVTEPVGNFLGERHTAWYAPNPPVGPEVHLAKGEASAAYTYGLNGIVWAEAFTGVDHAHAWKESPGYLKTWGDLWLTEGINRFTFHCWAHSPSLTQKPGITLGPWGIHFDRRNTWFDLASGYITYLSRCQFMLQHGLPAVDVCMLTGDGVVTEFPRHPELRAAGYDYHGLTTDVLAKATVDDGQILLPSGMRYRLLVTYSRELRPQTLRKLRDLVKAGATILGSKPEDAPGLAGYPASREEVRRVADELWGSDEAAGRKGRTYGKGKVFWGQPEKPVQGTSGCGIAAYLQCTREIEVLRDLRVAPDFQYALSGREDCDHMLAYVHRRATGMDWYFISNQAMRPRSETCTFRVDGRQPELWDPVTGEYRKLPSFRVSEGRTSVPLEFASGQSFFVVFRNSATAPAGQDPALNFEKPTVVSELTGPWDVAFDPEWGGPRDPVRFDELTDWSRRPEEGIRFYSGKATYRKTFNLPAKDSRARIYLHLGKVRDLAEVRLNGRNLGAVWCEPWRIEVTQAIQAGRNELELVVVNEWVNRLIGDSAKPKDQRFTWTTWNPYKPDSPLLESGLLGPVTFQATHPDTPQKELPVTGQVFQVADRIAFVIPARNAGGLQPKPWVWYAPTLPGLPGPEERWMFDKFGEAGIAAAGIDAGESYGSPAGCALYSAFYDEMTGRRGYSPRPVMLGRSRGGLMTLSWAVAHPDKVAAFAGIYPVCNLASYPGVTKASSAYGMESNALQSRLAEYNPIDRLAPLARENVPLFAIHGDSDTVVPLEANSGLMKTRYSALGGSMHLVVPPGQGHNMWTGFFQCDELVSFVKTHATR